MSIFSDFIPFKLSGTIKRMQRSREICMTERAIGALPEHIRRDLGWPDRLAERRYGRD